MKVYLGIELGSTRIKAVAIDSKGVPLASGGYDWENRFEDGIWTYRMDDVWAGLRASYKELVEDYSKKHGAAPEIATIGISAMMHGYLPLDKDDRQLAEFRTWRNTITGESAELLTKTFGFNIPMRWTAAHLHHAVKTAETHVGEIAYLATLAAYVHYKLTDKKVVGVGEASGIFPIDSSNNEYDEAMVQKFDALIAEYNLPWKLKDILPEILTAGDNAGFLTEN